MARLRTLLILGVTGGFGVAAAQGALARGWRVRALHRRPAAARAAHPAFDRVDWRGGDAMRPADVAAAAEGADWILHGVNPPEYRNWRGLALPMLDATIAAAREQGARVLLPGNLYNYAPEAGPLIDETTPQNPVSKKGAVRVEMEQRLRAAGVGGAILRAGDFFGPHCPASWLPNAMLAPGKPLRSMVYPGRRDVGHAWAYLPDLAEAALRLIEAEAGGDGVETLHFEGHWFERGADFAERALAVAGRPGARVRSLPWTTIRLLAPVVRMARELNEMRYLWEVPLKLDNARLRARIGAEPHTPFDDAIRRTLEGHGCLGAPARPATPSRIGARSRV